MGAYVEVQCMRPSCPVSTHSSVVFPTPFPPTRPTRSPALMTNETSLRTVIAPYVFARLYVVNSIAYLFSLLDPYAVLPGELCAPYTGRKAIQVGEEIVREQVENGRM